MNQSLFNTIVLAGIFLVLFLISEFLYRVIGIKAEVTRKIVHISTGLLTMLFPFYIQELWLVVALCGSFLMILITSMMLKLLPSINAVNRKTYGSILYPIIVVLCFVCYLEFNQFTYYYIPILILAICDPIAAFIGKRWPWGHYKTFKHYKTLSGSFGFLLTAFFLCFFLLFFVDQIGLAPSIFIALIISFSTAVIEAFSHKGLDNLTIPLVSIILLYFSFEIIY